MLDESEIDYSLLVFAALGLLVQGGIRYIPKQKLEGYIKSVHLSLGLAATNQLIQLYFTMRGASDIVQISDSDEKPKIGGITNLTQLTSIFSTFAVLYVCMHCFHNDQKNNVSVSVSDNDLKLINYAKSAELLVCVLFLFGDAAQGFDNTRGDEAQQLTTHCFDAIALYLALMHLTHLSLDSVDNNSEFNQSLIPHNAQSLNQGNDQAFGLNSTALINATDKLGSQTKLMKHMIYVGVFYAALVQIGVYYFINEYHPDCEDGCRGQYGPGIDFLNSPLMSSISVPTAVVLFVPLILKSGDVLLPSCFAALQDGDLANLWSLIKKVNDNHGTAPVTKFLLCLHQKCLDKDNSKENTTSDMSNRVVNNA